MPVLHTIAPDFPETILVDEEWLWQICVNLLSNASKYTSKGHIELCVMRSSGDAGTFDIEVRDTGIGIAIDHRSVIFEKFRTLQAHNMESTGIGLYVVKSKCDLMKGSITVSDNDEGEGGTIFRVTLPLVIATEHEEQRVGTPPPPHPVDSTPLLPPSRPSCLVVDDSVSIRRMICRVLKDYSVTTACNGAEALELMRDISYDVVLMDVMMPVMDGSMCVKLLREHEERTGRRRQYVVMMSANCIEDMTQFDVIAPKPLSARQLIDIVRGAREHRLTMDETK